MGDVFQARFGRTISLNPNISFFLGWQLYLERIVVFERPQFRR